MKAVVATLISRISSFDASIRRAEARPVPIRLAHRTTRREFRADKQDRKRHPTRLDARPPAERQVEYRPGGPTRFRRLDGTRNQHVRQVARGGPPVIRLGGSVRWHRSEIEAWLAHRAPSGELYDATSWPAIWMQLQARKK